MFTAVAQEKKKGGPPKNLQILQPSEVGPKMQAFKAGLGVECTFCHVQGDMSSDDKPQKVMARKMITLTKDVNAKFPDGQEHVTCYTCHRGAEKPLTAPAAQ